MIDRSYQPIRPSVSIVKITQEPNSLTLNVHQIHATQIKLFQFLEPAKHVLLELIQVMIKDIVIQKHLVVQDKERKTTNASIVNHSQEHKMKIHSALLMLAKKIRSSRRTVLVRHALNFLNHLTIKDNVYQKTVQEEIFLKEMVHAELVQCTQCLMILDKTVLVKHLVGQMLESIWTVNARHAQLDTY